jgi:hypothetical protein
MTIDALMAEIPQKDVWNVVSRTDFPDDEGMHDIAFVRFRDDEDEPEVGVRIRVKPAKFALAAVPHLLDIVRSAFERYEEQQA